MKISLITLLILIAPLTTIAQSKFLKNQSEIQSLSERVAKSFYEVEPSKGLNELKEYQYNNNLPKNIVDMQYGRIIDRFQKQDYLYKNPQTYFLSSEKELGEVGKEINYIVQYNREIIKLTFFYFKSDKGWYLDSFDMTNNYKTEFK